ncbi:MAG: HRDC domain-containing protein [Bacteroidia bacterium]
MKKTFLCLPGRLAGAGSAVRLSGWLIQKERGLGRSPNFYKNFSKNNTMQIRIFSIPVVGGEMLMEDLNVFLRSKKVLQIEQHMVNDPQGSIWCFCIRYVEDYSPYSKTKEKVDYRKILDEESFGRFAAMREIRKKLAEQLGFPPYAIFNDEELAELAKIENLTPEAMKGIKGIGEKKVEKYGVHFILPKKNETSQSPV